ncbi:MAG: tRNA lysidine(34) synthetase TilS [Betaproteobacteria bacterium]|nr:tRNA lysidine(34) synthetase TilS [Betaproteobacteria bacterium]
MTRRAQPSPVDAVRDAVAEALRRCRDGVTPGAALAPRVAVALSGGGDSMLLLDVLAELAADIGVVASAVHVHHGLSPHADAWAAFCATACAARSLPLVQARVAVAREPGRSLEASARAARYAAFAALDVDAVALAHHADDQAETLLLQLLRGAGPAGLAAMGAQRAPRHGPLLLRPLLALPRATLLAAARARRLDWIDDESNADVRIRRNYLRAEIAPRLAGAFPGYPQTLLRAAAHQADAARLADELAAVDAQGALGFDPVDGPTLECARLVALAADREHRARNLLRWFLRRHDLAAPSADRLDAMLRQLVGAAADARVRLVHEGLEIGIHRRRIVVHAPAARWTERRWNGESEVVLPHGRLVFASARGRGLAGDGLASGSLLVRPRQGGERLRPGRGRPRQLLTHLFQQQGVPTWQRDGWPLLYCGDTLVAVPGVGVDPGFAAGGEDPGVELVWLPQPRQSLMPVNPEGGIAG